MTITNLVDCLEKTWQEHDHVTDPELQGDYDSAFTNFLKMIE